MAVHHAEYIHYLENKLKCVVRQVPSVAVPCTKALDTRAMYNVHVSHITINNVHVIIMCMYQYIVCSSIV